MSKKNGRGFSAWQQPGRREDDYSDVPTQELKDTLTVCRAVLYMRSIDDGLVPRDKYNAAIKTIERLASAQMEAYRVVARIHGLFAGRPSDEVLAKGAKDYFDLLVPLRDKVVSILDAEIPLWRQQPSGVLVEIERTIETVKTEDWQALFEQAQADDPVVLGLWNLAGQVQEDQRQAEQQAQRQAADEARSAEAQRRLTPDQREAIRVKGLIKWGVSQIDTGNTNMGKAGTLLTLLKPGYQDSTLGTDEKTVYLDLKTRLEGTRSHQSIAEVMNAKITPVAWEQVTVQLPGNVRG